ncbi:sigma-70 family RNA polymerase sigma factor [Acidothermaceae bacterium B102]|nr:sigma-70 family RNA polymerase sigma factor [Acidothermaceae bacterium B102]
MQDTLGVESAVAEAFAEQRGRVLATLIRLTGDWDLAEECVQDAFVRALQRWPVDGVPRSPGAWLTTTARNRAIDRMRRANVEAGKLQEAAITMDTNGSESRGALEDDRLRLIFTCCHPALSLESRVALTLRTVAGLTTEEIARAFLTPTPTMAQRLVRAKSKIRAAGIPYRVPPVELLASRTEGVLAVVYLLFNEGYAASAGATSTRTSLTSEAIRLSRLLVQLLPDEPEAAGLLALMLLQDSRRRARSRGGAVVTLEDQDRSLWDREQIDEGIGIVWRTGLHGPYTLQAAIAACHCIAPTAADTDWTRIASLYGTLADLTPSPFVQLNRAVAVAMADGPAVGLVLVDELAGALPGYHLLPATRADLLRRLGRTTEAAAAYRDALALASNDADRAYLERRLAALPLA